MGFTAMWRPMAPGDLTDVEVVGARVHPDHPEDDAVFQERLSLFPAGCLVLRDGPALIGYAISHPGTLNQPPKLNTLLGALPAHPDSFYIHDLALLPEARGPGAGAAAVAHLAGVARVGGFATLSLVSVSGSAGFWHRLGFATIDAMTGQVASYGPSARYMVRRLS